jgi:uncharacterized MAPEG superfamily protein|tara:strand:- start:277 stop:663 length:387 start_codon:yes stop_codon:yes gene_type:complete
MTIAFWTLLFAIMLPWLMALIKKTPSSLHGKYNNRAPRAGEQDLQGVSQRVSWAEQNSYEILPGYIAAIIVSYLVGAEQYCIDIFALIFIGSRILYCLCYIKDWPSLRSAVWVVGLLCIIAIFVTSAL